MIRDFSARLDKSTNTPMRPTPRTLLFALVVAAAAVAHASRFGKANDDNVKIVLLADRTSAERDGLFGDATRVVPIGLANGSRYECDIPPRSSTAESDQLWRAHLRKVRDHAVPAHLVDGINRALAELCFAQPAGWWTYELCWGRHLRQFHADANGNVEVEYFLGKGPALRVADGAVDELVYDVDLVSDMRARLVAEWFNGTVCDLTQRQRHMQLFLLCAPRAAGGASGGGAPRASPQEHGELIVVEPSSCEYQVTLKHAAFCAVPELRERERPEVVVSCVDVTPPEQDAEPTPADAGAADAILGLPGTEEDRDSVVITNERGAAP